MTDILGENYPRPDFARPNLTWTSLNGPWDFLFDDEDEGLREKWHLEGLPESATVASTQSSEAAGTGTESEDLVAKIAGGTSKLREGNFTQKNRKAATNSKRKIEVPYVFQAPASGIGERSVHEVLWYERLITDLRTEQEKSRGYKLLVRFGAVDYEAKVWVNGKYVGGHRGGHTPFDVDVTDAIGAVQSKTNSASSGEEEHRFRLTVRVYDSAYDLTQPRGKQYWGAKPESIFYTPSSGIWQSVWLESVPPARIGDSRHGTISRSNDSESGELHATVAILGRRAGRAYAVEVGANFQGTRVGVVTKALPRETDVVEVSLGMRLSDDAFFDLASRSGRLVGFKDNLALWAPEHPHLYNLTIRLFDSDYKDPVDTVQTYTGMRFIDWTTSDGTFRLNGKPIFQALCLDQGYWPNTFMTPPSPSSQSLKRDIELSKALGFNGCRKHQKVEDPLFLYWADKLGYLVWGEMANGYQFSSEYVERFDQEWKEAVKRDINHPSIVAWTPVNESWGYGDLVNNIQQRQHIRSLYHTTKTLDPTRPINDNCGWQHVMTDLTTFHDYADSPALASTCSSLSSIIGPKADRGMFLPPIPNQDPGSEHKDGAPVICTEFGGVNIAPAGGGMKQVEDRQEFEEGWGYTTAANPDDLLERVKKLVDAVVDGGLCCGFVWTQFADIEQETNGLYTFDRTPKLDVKKVREVMEGAKERYYERLKREG